MIELLAPVGSHEALVAAVESGADAVYLAGKMFGARAYAPNFDNEQLAEAVRFAHLRGVLVYVAVNTLVDNSEMTELAEYLQCLYQIGVDAIIVQDVGVAYVASQIAPKLPIHGSTQMTIHNLAGVQFLADLGFARVVLAREVSLSDIEYICKNTDIEIETFIHGALCICYSGQCLMSSMIGGRSGNRGRCAQPCRLPYTLVDESGNNVLQKADAGEYLLSPKDLSTIELLPDFINAGVKSLKIEGRMKRPEYVAVVVDAYRRAIDAYLADRRNLVIDNQDKKDLAQIFNRDFTTAYLIGKPGRTMMSDRRPNNRGVRIGRVVSYQAQQRTATIKLDEPLCENDIVEFWVKIGGRVSATISSMTVQGKPVSFAPAGVEVSIPVQSPVRVNDRVFKVFDAQLMERARSFFAGASAGRRIQVTVKVEVAEGLPLVVTMLDADGFLGQGQTDFIAEKALKRPLTKETITKQIERLGTTVFELGSLDCKIDGEVMVPVSEINEARRRAVEELEQARLARFDRPLLKQNTTERFSNLISLKQHDTYFKLETKKLGPQLVVNVDSVDKVRVVLQNGADIVMFGGENFSHKPFTAKDYRQVLAMVREYNKKIIFSTPRLVKEWQVPALKTDIELFNDLQPDAVSIGNLGTLHMVRQLTDLSLHGDYQLNVYNNLAIEFFAKQGIESLTLSPELNFGQVEELVKGSSIAVECMAHGYLALMVSEYCTIGSYLGEVHSGLCNNACLQGHYWLKDRKNEKFPIVTDQFCRMHVLNAKELSLASHVPKFGQIGVDRIRIEGKYGTPEYLGKITKLYREMIAKGKQHSLLVQDNLGTIENDGITRGHYFRGVL